MIETLQFGGGIVSVKPIYTDPSFEDFGYCHDFSVKIDYTEEFRSKYIAGPGNRLIRVTDGDGILTAVTISGKFVCESMTRKRLQSMWFRGSSSSAGSELLEDSEFTPIISGLRFISVSNFGPVECLKLPKVHLKIEDERPLMGYEWRNLEFSFEAFLEEGYMPTLRVQQEGETLTGFCE